MDVEKRPGLSSQLTTDNGPEFGGRALDAWAYEHNGRLDFIQPGRPTQNGFVESLNGKFRDECFNPHGSSPSAKRELLLPPGATSQQPQTSQFFGQWSPTECAESLTTNRLSTLQEAVP
ncbi:MAG: hypothetical protein B6A08_13645 [Sorangiineae bacterium NIC37A_2]|jgi:putative transposase|nr:MAG: hypothetical protein B6A08_13645 [Sorangiineae bacterium NIC37A_2]